MLDNEQQIKDLSWLGTTYRIVMKTEDTGGAMSMFVSVTPPGFGPPRHIHDAEDEAFYILEGEIEVWLEGRLSHAGPGETIFIPRGAEHTFRNCGKTPSRHLVVLTPGGFEHFFEDMAAGQYRIPEDMPAVIESGNRHSLRFTGPPL